MAYNQELAERARLCLAGEAGLSERKMFGGLSFMLNGNMACGVIEDTLIVRVGPQAYEDALQKPHSKVFDLTGRPMSGWVQVLPAGLVRDADLADWIQTGLDYARTLPPK